VRTTRAELSCTLSVAGVATELAVCHGVWRRRWWLCAWHVECLQERDKLARTVEELQAERDKLTQVCALTIG